jgi:hypothetical protein
MCISSGGRFMNTHRSVILLLLHLSVFAGEHTLAEEHNLQQQIADLEIAKQEALGCRQDARDPIDRFYAKKDYEYCVERLKALKEKMSELS